MEEGLLGLPGRTTGKKVLRDTEMPAVLLETEFVTNQSACDAMSFTSYVVNAALGIREAMDCVNPDEDMYVDRYVRNPSGPYNEGTWTGCTVFENENEDEGQEDSPNPPAYYEVLDVNVVVPPDAWLVVDKNTDVLLGCDVTVEAGAQSIGGEGGSIDQVSDCGDDDPSGGGNTLPGSIGADKTLGEGTWTVPGKTVVTNGATLTIAPGATLKFASDADLIVEPGSKIIADGTANEPVVFDEANGGQHWSGTIVQGDGSRFDYVKVRNAGRGSGDNTRPALQIQAQNVQITNSVFSYNAGVAIEAGQTPGGPNSSFTLAHSTLRENRAGLRTTHSDVTLTNNTIAANERSGITIEEGTHATIQNNRVKGNGLRGIEFFGGTADLFKYNTIKNNGQGGLELNTGAYVYLDGNSQNRIFNNGSHEVYTGLSARVYLGDATYGDGGYNEIHDTGGYGSGHRYVKNTTSWTVPAEMNDWGGPSDETPTSAMFAGPVDYEPFVSPPLSVSILCGDGSDYNGCTAYASGGGGSYTYDWSGAAAGCTSRTCTAVCESSAYVTVTSATGETASDQASTGTCAPDDGGGGDCPPGELCVGSLTSAEPYSTLDEQALQSEIEATEASLQTESGSSLSTETTSAQTSSTRAAASTPSNDGAWLADATATQKLHRLYSLMLLKARVEQVRSDRRNGHTNAFAGRRSQMRALFASYAEAPSSAGGHRSSAARGAARDAARQILVENLIRSSRPDQALRSAHQYAAGMSTGEARARMHLHRAMAFEQKEQFKQALRAVEIAEKQWPGGDYASLRIMLLRRSGDPRWKDIAERRQQATSAEAAAASSASAAEALQIGKMLPQEFALEAPYPNPTSSGRVTVPLALPERAEVRAALYDVLGRRVQVITDRSFAAGRPKLTFSTEGLSSGLYLIRVEVETASGKTRAFTEEVTVVR